MWGVLRRIEGEQKQIPSPTPDELQVQNAGVSPLRCASVEMTSVLGGPSGNGLEQGGRGLLAAVC